MEVENRVITYIRTTCRVNNLIINNFAYRAFLVMTIISEQAISLFIESDIKILLEWIIVYSLS